MVATEGKSSLDTLPLLQTPARWLQVVSHLDPRFGGLSTAVPHLASELVCGGRRSIEIEAFCAPDEVYAAPQDRGITVREWPASREAWRADRDLTGQFAARVAQSDGVHIHGLWEKSTAVAAEAARAAGKPYMVSAHGMLEPWALRQKRLKKWVYSLLVERPNLRAASCLHALTSAEAQHYRTFGLRVPIAVIPNGVSIPEQTSPEVFREKNSALNGKRIVLFLGRLHAKKGLDLLVSVWPQVLRRCPEAHLVLAGPDSDGTRARLEHAIEAQHLEHSVTFAGMLRDSMKWSALASAEVFILPSYSEGLAISVLEAMGVGAPVLISENCHMPEVAEIGAGAVVRAEAQAIGAALGDLLTQTPEANRAMGRRGQAFVRQHYSWPRVAEQMAEVYDWLQGGSLPTSVDLRLERQTGGRA